MAELEKVIKGLECCSVKQSCLECPWMGLDCNDRLHLAALELLKEQPEQKFFVDSDGKMTPLPVQKHGHWIRLPKFLSETQCSVCKKTNVGDYRTFKFCPDCGARMDEEVKQE